MKQYERFLIYGLLLILLILAGWFVGSKTKAERYKCWPCSEGDYVGAYILDTKTGHLYMAKGTNKIRDLGVIEISKPVFDLQPLTNKKKNIFEELADENTSTANK
ncbi:MAG: hypothetical protein MUO27_10050 [Sedimentisphaerales bacterium]|nr:hypothetical protein [Sedimentisphaerales bacterium]